jgi:hypothetical protein
VAPSTGELLRQHDALLEAEGGASELAARAAVFQCRSGVWATRFRRCLGVNLATPIAEERIGVEERQRKAPLACAFGCGRVPRVRACAVPNSGPLVGPRIGTVQYNYNVVGPILVPNSGPISGTAREAFFRAGRGHK